MSGGRLVVLDRTGRDVKRYSLPHGLVTLGSDPACDIRVMLPTVSAHHASVLVRAHQTIVRNVSDGETLLNGQPVSVAALQHGDTITLGDRSLRWEYDQPAAVKNVPSQPALMVKRSKQRGGGRKRASETAPRRMDPSVQLMLEMNHRASMPGGGKQVAVVQPQRRGDIHDSQDVNPRLIVKPHRPYTQTNKRQRSSKGETSKNEKDASITENNDRETSKRKTSTPRSSPKTPTDLQNTTKATLWIESRKTSPRKSAQPPNVFAPVTSPRRGAVSAKKSTPLRTVVLRKAITPNFRLTAQTNRKTPVAKIQAPLEIDYTKQAALMLMTGRTPKTKPASPKEDNARKSPTLVIKKPSPVRKTPTSKTPQRGRKSSERHSKVARISRISATPKRLSNNTPQKSTRQTKSGFENQSVSVLEITDSDAHLSRSSRSGGISSLKNYTSPTLPSPKKSALKDPSVKKGSRKTESIKFDFSNLDNYSYDQSTDIMIISNSPKGLSINSDHSMSDEEVTLHYSDVSQPKSPSPRKSIHSSRSSKILEKSVGKSTSISNLEKSTLTPESPNSRRSFRGSLMVQKVLESPSKEKSPRYSNRTTLTEQGDSILNRTRTVSPNSPHQNLESYSIVDLVSINESSSSVYNSAGSVTPFGTPRNSSRKSRSTIGSILLGSSTPYMGKKFNANQSLKRKSSIKSDSDSMLSSDHLIPSKRSKSLTTPKKSKIDCKVTPQNKRSLSENRTRTSRSSRKMLNDSDLLILSPDGISSKLSEKGSAKSPSDSIANTKPQAKPQPPKHSLALNILRNSSPTSNKSTSLKISSSITQSPIFETTSNTVRSSRSSASNSIQSPVLTPKTKSPRFSKELASPSPTFKTARHSSPKSKHSSRSSLTVSSEKSIANSSVTPNNRSTRKSVIAGPFSPTPKAVSPSSKRKSNSVSTPLTLALNNSTKKYPTEITSSKLSLSNRKSAIANPSSKLSNSERKSSIGSPSSKASVSRRKSASASPSTKLSISKRKSNVSLVSPRLSISKRTSAFASPSPELTLSKRKSSIPSQIPKSSVSKRNSAITSPGAKLSLSNQRSNASLRSSIINRKSEIASLSPKLSLSNKKSSITSRSSKSSVSKRKSTSLTPVPKSSISKRKSSIASLRLSHSNSKLTKQSPQMSISSRKSTKVSAKLRHSNRKSVKLSPKSNLSSSKRGLATPQLTDITMNSPVTSSKSNKKSTNLDSESSPRKSKTESPKSNVSKRKYLSSPNHSSKTPTANNRSRRNLSSTPSNLDDGLHTPENRPPIEDIGTPVLNIQSLIDSSLSSSLISHTTEKRRKSSTYLKRKTIGERHSRAEARSGRMNAKSQSLNLSTARQVLLSKDLIDEIASHSKSKKTVTPKSTVKLLQQAVKEKHSTAKKPQSKRSIIDNLNDSDIVKQLFNSPVKRKLSKSMTEFSKTQLLEEKPTPKKRTRNTIANSGHSPDQSLLEHTESFPAEVFVSPLNTPSNSPNLTGIKRLFRKNTPQNDLTNIKGVKKLLQTPRNRKSVKNDLSNIDGVKNIFAKSPMNRLSDVRGVKEVFATSPTNDLRRVSGVKSLFQSEKKRKSKNYSTEVRDSDSVIPRNKSAIKNVPKSPKNNRSGVWSVKRKSVKENSKDGYNDLSGVEELFDMSLNSERNTHIEASSSEDLFDRLIGKPQIKATYAKSFVRKPESKPLNKRAAKSLNKSYEYITNNVEEWLETELQKRIRNDDSNIASKSQNNVRKSTSQSKNTSNNVSRQLQMLVTDTVEGNVPIRKSRVRTSTIVKGKSSDLPAQRSAADIYGEHTLPIKKRSLIEKSLEKSSNNSKLQLPIKKRALVHSTPVKGKWNITANASELGRVSPIVAENTVIANGTILSSQNPKDSPKAKVKSPTGRAISTRGKGIVNTPKGKRNTPKGNKGDKLTEPQKPVSTVKSPDTVRTGKVSTPAKASLSTRNKKSIGAADVTNTKKRRGSLVISKKTPVLSPKPRIQRGKRNKQQPQDLKKHESILIKNVDNNTQKEVAVPKATPKKTTRATRGRKAEVNPERTSANKIRSPKVTPKKITRANRGNRNELKPNRTPLKEIASPKNTPKQTTRRQNAKVKPDRKPVSKVASPKVTPKKATRGQKFESKMSTPKQSRAKRGKNSAVIITKPSPIVKPKKQTRSKKVASPVKDGPKTRVAPRKQGSEEMVETKRGARKNVAAKEVQSKGEKSKRGKKITVKVESPKKVTPLTKSTRKAKLNNTVKEPKTRGRKITEIVTEVKPKRGKSVVSKLSEEAHNTPKGRKRKVASTEKEMPQKSSKRNQSIEIIETKKTTRSRKTVVKTTEVRIQSDGQKKSVMTENKKEINKISTRDGNNVSAKKTSRAEKSKVVEVTDKKTKKAKKEEVELAEGEKVPLTSQNTTRGRKRKSDQVKGADSIETVPRKTRKTAASKTASPVKAGRSTRGKNTDPTASTSTRSRRR